MTETAVEAYRERVETLYRCFFRDMTIDPETGESPRDADRKFAAYPYIGLRYGADSDVKKLLVVGLDIGSDETPGQVQHFEKRRRAIELTPLPALNPHIAGTYFTALKYACPQRGWARFSGSDSSCQRILRKGDGLPADNPLSFMALTNFYKWVTKDRRNKGGARDRAHVDRRRETALFLEEVRLLVPDVVVFQGVTFSKPWFREVLDVVSEVEWHVLVHPSWRGSRRPKDITQPRLSSTTYNGPGDEPHGPPPQPAPGDLRPHGTDVEIESYRGLHRDDASVLSLIDLDGQNREVWIYAVAHHARECGYEKHDIPFACRWLKKFQKPVRGFVITRPRRGYYRLEKATRAQIAAWKDPMT